MTDRASVRSVACAELVALEHRCRRDGAGLNTAAELDATRLLSTGLDLPEGLTNEQRADALARAWQRVDKARLRSQVLRCMAGLLRPLLVDLGLEPVYDFDAPPETVRTHEVEASAVKTERAQIDLDKGVVVEAAERHGIMWEDDGVA